MNIKEITGKIIVTLILFASCSSLFAATSNDSIPYKRKVINGGIKLQANCSNFIMNIPIESHSAMKSVMNVGAEIGGFIDFNVSEHCVIQFNLMVFSEQQDLHNSGNHDRLWTVGVELPLYVLGRFGNQQHGYILFGGGPYTEFSTWARMIGSTNGRNPYQHIVDTSEDGESIFALSDNHSGLAAYLGYEFPFGLQINATYQASLSNILNLNNSAAYCYPQKVTLGLGYRFK